MKDLTKTEREFLEHLKENHYLSKSKGYTYYQDKKFRKNYKRSRVFFQLHHNKKLEIWEQVHHKDGNKENDNINNLKVFDTKIHNHHTSLHIAGTRGRKNKPRKKSNKLNQEIINKIFKLSKIYTHSNGKPHYSKIGKEIGISDNSIRNYLTGKYR